MQKSTLAIAGLTCLATIWGTRAPGETGLSPKGLSVRVSELEAELSGLRRNKGFFIASNDQLNIKLRELEIRYDDPKKRVPNWEQEDVWVQVPNLEHQLTVTEDCDFLVSTQLNGIYIIPPKENVFPIVLIRLRADNKTVAYGMVDHSRLSSAHLSGVVQLKGGSQKICVEMAKLGPLEFRTTVSPYGGTRSLSAIPIASAGIENATP